MNFTAYDNQLLKEADRYLTNNDTTEILVADVGIPADDKQELFKWAVRVYDEYTPAELTGKYDWTGELILPDDDCTYLDIEDLYVPKFKEEVQESLIELYGTEEI